MCDEGFVREEPQAAATDTATRQVTSSWDMMPLKQQPPTLQARGSMGSAWTLDNNVKCIVL